MSAPGVFHHPALADRLPWEVERGAFAYEAYRRAHVEPMPKWEDLSPETMRAWIEAAWAICSAFGAIY